MSKHTPGPWTIEQNSKMVLVCADRIDFSAPPSVKAIRHLKSGKVAVTRFSAAGMPLGEALANASLIAAAPDLLAACQSVWLMLANTGDNELRLIADEARAAITKATGSKVS